MDLLEIRRGVASVLEDIPECRVYPTIPEALAASGVTALVVAAGDPYVTYSEGAGFPSLNQVMIRIVIVPPQQAGAERILSEIDALLSCGSDQPRSIRTLMGANISANGTACSVSPISAQLRTLQINDYTAVVGELDLNIKARC